MTRGWTRHELDLGKAGAMLRAAGYEGCPGDPLQAYAHCDRNGRWRRVHARYESGWRATLSIRLNGTGSLSSSKKIAAITVSTGKGGA